MYVSCVRERTCVTYVYECICGWEGVRVASMWDRACLCACIKVWMCICVNPHLSVSVCVSACVNVHICVNSCLSVYVCVCVCLCTSAYVKLNLPVTCVHSFFSFIVTTSTCPGQSKSLACPSNQWKLTLILLCLVLTCTPSHNSLSWPQ